MAFYRIDRERKIKVDHKLSKEEKLNILLVNCEICIWFAAEW